MSKKEEIQIGPSITVKPTSNEVSVDWTKLGYTEELLGKHVNSSGDADEHSNTSVKEYMDQIASRLLNAQNSQEEAVKLVTDGNFHLGGVMEALNVVNVIKEELKKRDSKMQITPPRVMPGGVRADAPSEIQEIINRETPHSYRLPIPNKPTSYKLPR